MKIIIICYVDNMLMIGANKDNIYNLKKVINPYIELERIMHRKSFLLNKIIIDYKSKRFYINQTLYIERWLNKFDISIQNKKPILIPGIPEIKLNKNNKSASKNDINNYPKQIGFSLYLVSKTRLDIAYNIIFLSRFMQNPLKDHFIALDYIWKYLLKFLNLELLSFL